jgi:triphosphoribosyl-dephospho-CoA synthase
MPPLALLVQTACIWEATARKAGNVHRHADFADLTYPDFLLSAAAAAEPLAAAATLGVGPAVLEAIRRTRMVTATNTNLGIALLLAPLAAVPPDQELAAGIETVLSRLTVADAVAVYEAIRLAQPGGLGKAEAQDVADEPTQTLREVMALAADRDLIARQYANGFREVLGEGVSSLANWLRGHPLEVAIIGCHLDLLAQFPDSLIARKYGLAEAEEVSRRAQTVRDLGWPGKAGRAAFRAFDAWLREPGRRRNPGTTADLVAATLFAALRGGTISLPPARPWTAANLFDG